MPERLKNSEEKKSMPKKIGVAVLNVINKFFELTGLKKNEKRR